MSPIKFLLFLSVVVLTFGAQQLLAATTYGVGTCLPTLPSFSTISDALTASPAPETVEVCPGTYPEQIVITKPVTLEGISSSSSAQVVIAVPKGGLHVNAFDAIGNPDAVQVLVKDATGPVNISRITVDAAGNKITGNCSNDEVAVILGLFYQNSSGTVNHVTTRYQEGNGCGIGIQMEGGSSNPSVTVENCDLHDFDFAGIEVESGSGSPDLTATITGNDLSVVGSVPFYGIQAEGAVTMSVADNLVIGGPDGAIEVQASGNGVVPTGSITGNTLVGGQYGLALYGSAPIAVTSNRIFNESQEGIVVDNSLAIVEDNNVTQAQVGIDFMCTVGSKVQSNTIFGMHIGVANVPGAFTVTSNTFDNVTIIRSGSCP
jgi:nitrous oxidase accessory protein NosD